MARLAEATELTKVVTKGYGYNRTQETITIPKAETPEGGYDWDNDPEGAQAAYKAAKAWKQAYSEREHSLNFEIRQLKSEVARLTELVETWELKELRTVEEEKAAKRAAKAEREAARLAKREAKIDAQVAKYQKRIDSALRTKNSRTLADIRETAPRKLRELSNWTLTAEEALERLGREEVWAAFEAIDLEPFGDLKGRNVYDLMNRRMDRVKGEYGWFNPKDERDRRMMTWMLLEWPAELGGENKKGAKTLAEMQAKLA